MKTDLKSVGVKHGVINKCRIGRHAWTHVLVVPGVDSDTRMVRESPELNTQSNLSVKSREAHGGGFTMRLRLIGQETA